MIRELIDTDLEAVAGGFDVTQYLTNTQTNSLTQSASATSYGDYSPATAVNAVGNQFNSANLVAIASKG
jgi:hypothetical protein